MVLVFLHVSWAEHWTFHLHYYGPSMALMSTIPLSSRFVFVSIPFSLDLFCVLDHVRNREARIGISCCQMQVHWSIRTIEESVEQFQRSSGVIADFKYLPYNKSKSLDDSELCKNHTRKFRTSKRPKVTTLTGTKSKGVNPWFSVLSFNLRDK